jgi:hypothetical protein
MECEGCGKRTSGYELFDYCAECSANLCSACMSIGHCGHVPATSGQAVEDEDDVF